MDTFGIVILLIWLQLSLKLGEGRQLQSVRVGLQAYKKSTCPGHSPWSGHAAHASPTPATPTHLIDYGGGDNGGAGGGDDVGEGRQLQPVLDGSPPYKTPALAGHSPESDHGSPTPATPTPLLDYGGGGSGDNGGADGGYYLLGIELGVRRQLQSVPDGRPPYKMPPLPGHSPGSSHGPPNPPVPTPLLDYSGGASGDNGGAGGGDDDAVKDGGMDDEMKT